MLRTIARRSSGLYYTYPRIGYSYNPKSDVALYLPLWHPGLLNYGILVNGTGLADNAPVNLVVGDNTITASQAGTFTIHLQKGYTGTVTSGTAVITGSPVSITGGGQAVTAEGAGTFTVNLANVIVSKDLNEHLGTITGGVKGPQGWTADGDDYITVPDSDLFSFTDGSGNDTSGSVLIWVNLTNYTVTRTFIGKRNSATVLEWLLNVTATGELTLRLYNASGTTEYIGRVSSAATSTGVWLCLGFTYSGSETSAGCILYQNGAVLASSASETGVYAGMNNTVATINVGATNAGAANFLIGTVGEVWIAKNLILTANDIQRFYQRTNWRYQ